MKLSFCVVQMKGEFVACPVKSWHKLFTRQIKTCPIHYSNVSQTFGNRGPLHRRSVHMWTTFVKFPTPKKCIHVNRRNITLVVKVTITTFFIHTNLKHFIKYWSKDKNLWKKPICLLSVEGQNKTSFNTDMYMCIFQSLIFWYSFCNSFTFKMACRPSGEPPQATVRETLHYSVFLNDCTHL
jgi:hypothetical protein